MILTARKHLKTAAMVAMRSLDDAGWAIAVNFGMRLLRVAFLLSLWRMLLPETGEVSGMTRGAVLTYTLVAEAFSGLLDRAAAWTRRSGAATSPTDSCARPASMGSSSPRCSAAA